MITSLIVSAAIFTCGLVSYIIVSIADELA